MKNTNEKIKGLLEMDSLAEAEKITGKSYKEDDTTAGLGMLMQYDKSKKLKALLQEEQDTYFGIKFDEFTEIVENNGFLRIYEEKFESTCGGDDTLCLWADTSRGLLLVAESYGQTSLNSATVYGDYQLKEGVKWVRQSCSNGPIRRLPNIRSFDIDAREGMFTKLAAIEEDATFLPKWEDRNKFMWLLNYKEIKDPSYNREEAVTNKLANAPQEVKDMIGYENYNK